MSSERKDGVAGVDRMWDSQWVNVVNAPEVLEAVRNESAQDAVNIAVKLTEQAMAKNARQLAEERARLLEALRSTRGVLACALKSAAPDFFATDEDIASHLQIQKIDAAIALATQRKEPGA